MQIAENNGFSSSFAEVSETPRMADPFRSCCVHRLQRFRDDSHNYERISKLTNELTNNVQPYKSEAITVTRMGDESIRFRGGVQNGQIRTCLVGRHSIRSPLNMDYRSSMMNHSTNWRRVARDRRPRSHSIIGIDRLNGTNGLNLNSLSDDFYYENWVDDHYAFPTSGRQNNDLLEEEYRERIIHSNDPMAADSFEPLEMNQSEYFYDQRNRDVSMYPFRRRNRREVHGNRSKSINARNRSVSTRNSTDWTGLQNRLPYKYNSSNRISTNDHGVNITFENHQKHQHTSNGFKFKNVTVHTVENPTWF